MKLNQKSYYFFYRPNLFWILNGYKKNIVKEKNQFFIKKLKLRLPFELEIPIERTKFKIEFFSFWLQIQKDLEKLKIESVFFSYFDVKSVKNLNLPTFWTVFCYFDCLNNKILKKEKHFQETTFQELSESANIIQIFQLWDFTSP